MKQYTLIERITHKILLITNKYTVPLKRKKLNSTDFTIISNNCWGGICYEYYGLQKKSPTVGGYFFSDDYIKFISNLKHYLSCELKFINLNQSKHKEAIKAYGKENLTAPIALIDDIEFIFLHYKSKEEAKEKWERRKKRVNFNNLIFKFSFQNECTEELLNKFNQLELPGKKIMFVHKKEFMRKSTVLYPRFENENQLPEDIFYWNKYFDVTAFLNGKGIIRK